MSFTASTYTRAVALIRAHKEKSDFNRFSSPIDKPVDFGLPPVIYSIIMINEVLYGAGGQIGTEPLLSYINSKNLGALMWRVG